jgi:hypothetical protein
MSDTVENRRNRSGSALAAILTLLILIPVGYFFVQAWNAAADDRTATSRERQGVEYLTRLTPLVTVLAASQASALRGAYSAPSGLQAAMDGVTEVDRRLGTTLRTRDRWNDLSARIGQLPSIGSSTIALFQAHVEITDLLLALYHTVRDNAQLNRDADNDVSHLQQAAVEMPTAVVQAVRMADLSVLVANADSKTQPLLMPQFGGSLLNLDTTVNALTDNLQAAVDDTTSRTLSSTLINPLDGFRRTVEELQRGANPAAPDTAGLVTARGRMLLAMAGLAGPVLTETDGLLRTRLDAIRDRQRNAAIIAGAAVLLALLALMAPLVGRRRRSSATGDGGDSGRATGSAAVPDAYDNSLSHPVPAYGNEVSSTRRERSGALR